MPKKEIKDIRTSQKIIVPKGTINSTKDTIIEIPAGLYSQPIVIAKKNGSDNIPLVSFPNESQDGAGKFNCGLVGPSGINHYVDLETPSQPKAPSSRDVCVYTQKAPVLDQAEYAEQETVRKQLQEFQRARRKFLIDTSAIASSNSSFNVNESNMEERWGSSGTQTLDTRMRGNGWLPFDQMRQYNLKPRRKRSRHLGEELEPLCSPKCKYSKESLVNLNANIGLGNLLDLDSDESLGPFCSSSHSAHGIIRNKQFDTEKFNLRRMINAMDRRTPPGASKLNVAISPTESCPESACPHGSKKNDGSCAPCCDTKLPKTFSSSKSKALMTDSDFENIKYQLRKARQKLDEAVGLVSRTVSSSSSAFTAGRMTPETDSTPISSYTACKTYNKRYFEPTNFHQPQKCPLQEMTNVMSGFTPSSENRSRNTSNALCLDSCSSVQIPACASRETFKDKREVQQSILRRAENLNPSTVRCTPMLPCDIPFTQHISRPSSATYAKSLPTSSVNLKESLVIISSDRANTDSEAAEYRRYQRAKKRMDIMTDKACGMDQVKTNELKPLCSTMCLNMDPAPCTIQEVLNKKTAEFKDSLQRLFTRANSSDEPYKRMFPCEIPSTASTLTKNLPACSTMIGEESRYQRFDDSTDNRSISRICNASQTRANGLTNDLSCSSTYSTKPVPFCVSKEGKKKPKNQSCCDVNPKQSGIPCVPVLPCNIPSVGNLSGTSTGSNTVPTHSNERCGLNQSPSNELIIVCSPSRLNKDGPPCTMTDSLRKKTKEVQDSLDKLLASGQATAIPCKRMTPCEISSVTSRQDKNCSPPSSPRYLPASPTKIDKTPSPPRYLPASPTKIDKTPQKISGSPRTNDDSAYIGFRDSINRSRKYTMATSDQIDDSDSDDALYASTASSNK